MGSEPRHRQISRDLLAEIAAGRYGPGERLPSEAQLCQKFGVSRPTAARALRELQEQGLIDRRVGSGTYLRASGGTGPGAAHRQLGLLVPALGKMEIFEVICGELAGLARVHEIGILWGGHARPGADPGLSTQEAEALADHFVEKGVVGVFFAPFEHTADQDPANRRIVEKLQRAGIPVILLDRDLEPFPRRSPHDLVGIDNFAGGYILAEHLVKLGARRLAMVTRPRSAATVHARVAGARAALGAHGIEPEDPFVREGDPTHSGFVREVLAGRRVQAVICTNDLTAAEFMQSLGRLKVAVPGALRVVGFDDVRYATLLPVPLTTIQQPCREIAVAAFQAMRERIADPSLPPRSIMLTPRLIVRESCGAYRR
ncbi:MAG TPA: GntR family transcriptional regulator [Planctomycetota bacterium]|nr:GntR family transcriptional regulator [Planctomycetota bacterium]